MDIKYRILEVHEKEHSFIVRYTTDLITEDMMATFRDENSNIIRGRTDYSITIWDPNATPEEIDKQIKLNAPAQWFGVIEHMIQNESSAALDHVKSKLNVDHVYTHEPPQPIKKDETPALTEADVDNFIKKLNAISNV